MGDEDINMKTSAFFVEFEVLIAAIIKRIIFYVVILQNSAGNKQYSNCCLLSYLVYSST
jgi:hypothetical protein